MTKSARAKRGPLIHYGIPTMRPKNRLAMTAPCMGKRTIDLSRAGWTIFADEVTCEYCRLVLTHQAPSAHPVRVRQITAFPVARARNPCPPTPPESEGIS